jgi:hypothetical protein
MLNNFKGKFIGKLPYFPLACGREWRDNLRPISTVDVLDNRALPLIFGSGADRKLQFPIPVWSLSPSAH